MDNWPQNPWAAGDMAEGTSKGHYDYYSNSSGAGGNAEEFGMDGWGKDTVNPVLHVGTLPGP